jgi:hypothetical protein
MAINILTEPANPPIAGDYTLDQAIQHAAEVPQLSILSGWETVGAAPVAKQGAFIRHAGNTFQVQSADETISGTVTAGINYIRATETAGVIALAWVTSLTGYAYNPAYGGIYNGSGQQILRDITLLEVTDYIRGMSFGEDFNYIRLANGSVYIDGAITFPTDLTVDGTLTSDSVTSSSITSPTDLTIGSNILIGGSAGSISSFTLSSGNFFTIPQGIYLISRESTCWYGFRDLGGGDRYQLATTVFSDGTSRYYWYGVGSFTFYYRRIG